MSTDKNESRGIKIIVAGIGAIAAVIAAIFGCVGTLGGQIAPILMSPNTATSVPTLTAQMPIQTSTTIPATSTNPDLTVEAQEMRFVGSIYDAVTKYPVPNAKVILEITGGIASEVEYTDSKGSFFFNLKIVPQQYVGTLRVFADGYMPYDQNVNLLPDIHNLNDIYLAPLPTPTPESNGETTPILIREKWTVEYFGNTDLELPVLYRTILLADKNKEGGYTLRFSSDDKPSEVATSSYSVRFSGIFPFRQSGKYEFYCAHQDGCRIFVDSRNWLDAWWDGNSAHSMERNISSGEHIVVVEFYDLNSTGKLDVYWRLKKDY